MMIRTEYNRGGMPEHLSPVSQLPSGEQKWTVTYGETTVDSTGETGYIAWSRANLRSKYEGKITSIPYHLCQVKLRLEF